MIKAGYNDNELPKNKSILLYDDKDIENKSN